MAARQRIQSLLNDLELSDSGGIEANIAAATAHEHAQLDEELLGALKHRSPGTGDDDDDYSVTTADTDKVWLHCMRAGRAACCACPRPKHPHITSALLRTMAHPCALVHVAASICIWNARCCSSWQTTSRLRLHWSRQHGAKTLRWLSCRRT